MMKLKFFSKLLDKRIATYQRELIETIRIDCFLYTGCIYIVLFYLLTAIGKFQGYIVFIYHYFC